MSNLREDIYFAAVGDVHGDIYMMLNLLKKWKFQTGKSLSFILQVGDFEPHRHQKDLTTMDSPSKYKKLGDFPDFYRGQAKLSYPVYFIGGNHEPHGFLELYPNGGKISDNCYYFGRVGAIDLAGLKIVGLSGIYKENLFELTTRPPLKEISTTSNSIYIGFIESDIIQALEYERADILVLHEWPANITAAEDLERFLEYQNIGNEYASLLIEALQPKLVLCGHMHQNYRNTISLPSEAESYICCLANIKQKQKSIAIFCLTPAQEIIELIES